MITFDQATGNLSGPVSAVGYSGNTSGLNNPNAQDQVRVGPIPRGLWNLSVWEDEHPRLGPVVVHLIPDPSTNTFGRSGFFIHGDNAAMDHTASDGCIILNLATRTALRDSEEKLLTVV